MRPDSARDVLMPHESTDEPLFTDYIGKWHWSVAFGLPFVVLIGLICLAVRWLA